MKVTIRRGEWLRGMCGLLYDRATGRMCAQGFVGEACGLSREAMAGYGSFADIAEAGTLLSPRIYDLFVVKADEAADKWGGNSTEFCSDSAELEYHNTQLAEETMSINDSVRLDLSDGERERQLIELYAPHGVELEFVD
jgi:hypothetical protein